MNTYHLLLKIVNFSALFSEIHYWKVYRHLSSHPPAEGTVNHEVTTESFGSLTSITSPEAERPITETVCSEGSMLFFLATG
jgi:hypothetical protein